MENLHVMFLSWHSVNKVFTVVNVDMFLAFSKQPSATESLTMFLLCVCV